MEKENERILFVKSYLKSIEDSETDLLAKYYHKDAVQVEFPNRFNGVTTKRTQEDIVEGSKRGQNVILKQNYDIQKIYEVGDAVIVEILWSGIVSMPIGKLKQNDKMVAHFAMFLEFEDGKIIRQRNYDCFEAF